MNDDFSIPFRSGVCYDPVSDPVRAAGAPGTCHESEPGPMRQSYGVFPLSGKLTPSWS